MKRTVARLVLGLSACLFLCGSIRAADDGLALVARRAPGAGDVTLDWTGGQPAFHVYRSTSAASVLQPGNLLGSTGVRSWVDTPPPGALFFYQVTSDCIYSPPEVCDGADNDCNGIVDDPGSEASCHLPNATAQCTGGACAIAACAPPFADCDGDPANGCEADLTAEGNCGACGVTCSALFCTQGSACVSGACTTGAPRSCDDGEPCTEDRCDEPSRACIHPCTTAPCWTASVGPGAAGAPVYDTALDPLHSTSYLAKGSVLYAIRNLAEPPYAAGSIRWQTSFPSDLVKTMPSPVREGAAIHLFIASTDGFVHRVRASDGGIDWSTDTRRATCTADGLLGGPTVQLYASSNAEFQAAQDARGLAGHDLVFVATSAACGTTTANRVLAIDGTTGGIVWQLNADRRHMIGYASAPCSVDTARNSIYCGTDRPEDRAQNTLWSIDTTSGAVRWSGDAGSIHNRPVFANDMIYVASNNGSVGEYNPYGDGQGKAWHGTVVRWHAGTLRDPWPEDVIDIDGTPSTLVLLSGTGMGPMFGLTVSPYTVELLWGRPEPFVTLPVEPPAQKKVLFGTDDGSVEQLDLFTGKKENTAYAGPGPAYDPSLDVDAGADRLTLASGDASGVVARFCVPFQAAEGGCSFDADCAAMTTDCSVGRCDTGTRVCHREPVSEGAACDDGSSCTTGDTCHAGFCIPSDHSACACTEEGDNACASGSVCCGSGGSAQCVSFLTDPGNCGACGNACAADQACIDGACRRDPAAACAGGFTDATALNALGPALTGAAALTYGHTAAKQCEAYVSTFRLTPTPSAVVRVDPTGLLKIWNNPSPQTTPFVACDLSTEGGGFVFGGAINRPSPSSTTPELIEIDTTTSVAHVAFAGARTSSTVPFLDTRYDQGPVGPVTDRDFYAATGRQQVYVANLHGNGDAYVLEKPCDPCSWFETPLPGWAPVGPARVTAVAFGKRSGTLGASPRELYLAWGTKIARLDLDTFTTSTIDLADPGVFTPTIGGGIVSKILSLTVDPLYGDVYVEVKDAAVKSEILVVRQDLSVRSLSDCGLDLHLANVPPALLSTDGRLSAASRAELVRLVPIVNGPPVFAGYDLLP